MLNELVGPRLTHSQLQSQIHSDFHHNFPKLIMIISYLAMMLSYLCCSLYFRSELGVAENTILSPMKIKKRLKKHQ